MGMEFINTFLYVEIDIFAIVILILLLTTGSRTFSQEEQKMFHKSVQALIVVLLFDAITWIVDKKAFPGARLLNVAAGTAYWMSTLVPCYYGYLYCYEKIYGRTPSAKYRTALSIPVLIGQILLIANLFTGWIFYVPADNVYRRGPYYLLVAMQPFIYVFVAVIKAMEKSRDVHVYEKRQFRMLALYMGLPFLGSLLEIFMYGVPTTWICLTVSLVMCYLYIQNGDFASDATTRLNNRRRFDDYAAWKSGTLHGETTMYILMIDLNFFKAINDTYGHKEGDEALARTATALKKATAERPAFLARVGGDEFAIILNGVHEQDVVDTIADINRTMEEFNDRATRPYRISLAIGYAGMTGNDKIPFDRLFSMADQQMYEEKVRMKERLKKEMEGKK